MKLIQKLCITASVYIFHTVMDVIWEQGVFLRRYHKELFCFITPLFSFNSFSLRMMKKELYITRLSIKGNILR